MSTTDWLAAGHGALGAGRWDEARAAFESALAERETPEGRFGLGVALWWSGENHASVEQCSRAYVLFRRSRQDDDAAQCAVWLAITYKANFANHAAANGWVGRADRLLGSRPPGPLQAWSWIARAYRMTDLDTAEQLTLRSLEVGRAAHDVDLELVAIAQLGLIRVGRGDVTGGFALIDEAMAAVLGGERTSLDTVVYACCDMLSACELASDIERAAQWCVVADDFVDRYGCPFLYAECRLYYGSVLAARGRWDDAERELTTGLRITAGASPGLHARALARLAGLRIRQGRLEEADQLLTDADDGVEVESEAALAVAALLLARGDAAAAARRLEHRWQSLHAHHAHLTSALDLLVEAHLAAGDVAAAAAATERLLEIAGAAGVGERLGAVIAGARGRLAVARGDPRSGVEQLQRAVTGWSRLELPFEAARAGFDLARALGDDQPDAATEHARRALSTFHQLGADLEADRVTAHLRALGHAPRPARRGAGTLTDREREVLALVAAGLSNPEIAARLYVSRKTASHHVSSILAKLGVRNRAEAAAWAVRQIGPPDGE